MSEFESKKNPGRKNFIFGNRKASKEENQVLIERIDSLSEAAKLRNILSDKSPESFHDPIEFSWQAFWKTFIYENLPPVFLSPLAALILEGSPSRAWHVSQNRNLIALSTQHMPLPNIIVSWLITYPIDTVKSRMQSNLCSTIKESLQIGNLYHGLGYCLLRAFIVNGASFYTYEMTLSKIQSKF